MNVAYLYSECDRGALRSLRSRPCHFPRRVHGAAARFLYRLKAFLTATAPPAVTDQERAALFFEAVGKHDHELSRICFGYARSRAEYEDLRQDTLVNIWQGLRSYRRDSSLRTWVYRVTLNTCVSTLRQRSRELPTTGLDSLYDLVEETDSGIEMIRELHSGIALLSPTDKAIVLLWLDEMSYEQIAEMTGLGRNTVATRLRRAKEKLRNILKTE